METFNKAHAKKLARQYLDAAKKSPTGGVDGPIPGGHVRIACENGRVYVRARPGDVEFYRQGGMDFEFTEQELAAS